MSMPAGSQPPRLLDQLREAAQVRFGRPEPGERYADWSRRYILVHGQQHPCDRFAFYGPIEEKRTCVS
jgi:hypothetical protein